MFFFFIVIEDKRQNKWGLRQVGELVWLREGMDICWLLLFFSSMKSEASSFAENEVGEEVRFCISN